MLQITRFLHDFTSMSEKELLKKFQRSMTPGSPAAPAAEGCGFRKIPHLWWAHLLQSKCMMGSEVKLIKLTCGKPAGPAITDSWRMRFLYDSTSSAGAFFKGAMPGALGTANTAPSATRDRTWSENLDDTTKQRLSDS